MARASTAKELETPERIEPCGFEVYSERISDLVAEVMAKSQVLGARLHPATACGLADSVRAMNCYYSNLIEGHDTRPLDIERALAGDLDEDETKRAYQVEARNHIRLQERLDRLYATGRLDEPASVEFIAWLHREFYEGAPDAMLWVGKGNRRIKMTPGRLRSESHEDVTVGHHQPPSSERVSAFMDYFEKTFSSGSRRPTRRITAIPIAHHRLNFIHPFSDGNGRVSRLMSHAMCLNAGIGAHGLWSVSRGLARGLASRSEYKTMMASADMPRLNDLDGRGNLSLRHLEEFVEWFLKVMLDQIDFMSGLFDLDNLQGRLEQLREARNLRPESSAIFSELLTRGEMPRGAAVRVTGLKERTARLLLGEMVEMGLLGSATPKGPVSLRFPSNAAEILFPLLYPPDTA